MTPSPVKRYAPAHGLPRAAAARACAIADVQAALRDVPLDVLVVAAYGLILPQAVLDWPRHGCLNIHASLLPRWRGAAPIARAIEAGDAATGITIMQMDAGLDTGPMIRRESVPIAPRDTAGTLHDRLAAVGARLDRRRRCARSSETARWTATPQPARGVTYAAEDRPRRSGDRLDGRVPPRSTGKIRALVAGARRDRTLAGRRVQDLAQRGRLERSPARAGYDRCRDRERHRRRLRHEASRGLLRLTELQPAGGRGDARRARSLPGARVARGARFDAGPA